MAVQWQWIPSVVLSWSEISLYPSYADVDWISSEFGSSKTGQLPTFPGKLWPNYLVYFLGSSSPTEVMFCGPPTLRTCHLAIPFCGGYLKGKVYINKPQDIPQLQNAIEWEMCAKPRRMCEQVMTNFSRRLNKCIHNKGRHLNDVIFHVWQLFLNIPMVFLNSNFPCIY